jgi:hypothetical protein
LSVTNTLAYVALSSATKEKKFYNIDNWCQCYKTFSPKSPTLLQKMLLCQYSVLTFTTKVHAIMSSSLKLLQNKLKFHGKPLHHIIMFVGKAKSLPWSGTPGSFFTQAGSGLVHKHQTRLEGPSSNQHSSLLLTIINYGCKKVLYRGPRFTL